MRRTTMIVLVLLASIGQASGQQNAANDAAKNAEFQRWLEYYQDVANAYDIYLQSDPKTRLKVSPKPIMSYSHPAAMRGTHGAFFVWTRASLISLKINTSVISASANSNGCITRALPETPSAGRKNGEQAYSSSLRNSRSSL